MGISFDWMIDGRSSGLTSLSISHISKCHLVIASSSSGRGILDSAVLLRSAVNLF